jgi:hypothetical protein
MQSIGLSVSWPLRAQDGSRAGLSGSRSTLAVVSRCTPAIRALSLKPQSGLQDENRGILDRARAAGMKDVLEARL